jgi:Flp pilus assembly protein TadG
MRPSLFLGNRPRGQPRRSGIAAAELAILLPFLSITLLATIDFCRIYYYTQTLQNCATAAAFYASGTAQADPTTTTTVQAAQQAAVAEGTTLQPPLVAANVNVTTTSTTATVTVTYSFATLFSYTGVPPTLTITRTATVPIAPQTSGGS